MDKKNQILKYILMSLFAGLVVRYVPSFSLTDKEIIIIAGSISIFYAFLDTLLPSVTMKNNENKTQ